MGVAGSANGHAVQGRPPQGDLLSQWLVKLGRWARPRLTVAPWSSGLGLARTILALGSAATLIATPPEVLFAANGVQTRAACIGDNAAGAFCAFPAWDGQLARWVAVAVLLVVASGWRPRITAIPHWYLSWSLLVNAVLPDGGDQVTAVLTLLLIPIGLTDPRRWHWQPRPTSTGVGVGKLVAYTAIVLIYVQVAMVYFQSSVAKLGVTEWADGTAMYYFFQHQLFGSPPWLSPITDVIVMTPVGVALVTWLPVAIEFAIALGILLGPVAKRVLLILGLFLHAMIGVSMGLISFDLAMSGALLLYLLPIGHEVRLPARLARLAAPPGARTDADPIDTMWVQPAR